MLRPRMSEPSRRRIRVLARTARVGSIASALLSTLLASNAGATSKAGLGRIDEGLLELRIGLAVAGLALVAIGWWRRRQGAVEARGSGRRLLLGAVAVAAFAANYNLFVWTGLHRHELYHYYLGSKYFPELGYFDLYTCSIQAVGDGTAPAGLLEMTDLRSKQRRPTAEVLAAAPDCATKFGALRWEAFRSDVGRFRSFMGDEVWTNVLRDHGYNPSPVWTAIGRPLASAVPATPAGLWLLARIDLALLLVLFAAIGRGFGFEAACIAAIAWGSCGHTRYQWTGDAFLRQLWLAASLGALVLLRRGRPATAGALLALATLERVFPGAFFIGYGLREVCVWIRRREPTREFRRFAGGALATTVVAIVLATTVAGRGVAVWTEFAENTRGMLSFTPRNALGLDYALSFTRVPPPEGLGENETERAEIVQDYRRRTLAARAAWRWLGLGVLCIGLAIAAWRGAGRSRDGAQWLEGWEAAAMGAVLIPFVTMPGSYYIGFVLVGALLAVRRPRIALALLVASAAWAVALVLYGSRAIAYAASSWILIAYSLWMLGELAFAEPKPATEARSARP